MAGIRAAVVAVLALAAGCAGPWSGVGPAGPLGRPEPAGVLRVMTFNIRYGSAPDGPDAWPNRRAALFALVGERAPSILGVQEALRFQIDELAARFPHLGAIGVGRDDGAQRGEYAAILFDRRRLAPLASGQLWLSPTPERPGSLGWGARFLDVMPVGDTRIVIDVNPNRPDLLSHEGVAREIAAATGKQLHRPTHPPAASGRPDCP